MAIPCICLLCFGSLINLYSYIKGLEGMALAIVSIASAASWIIALFQNGIIYRLLFSCLHQYIKIKAKFECLLFALYSTVQIVIVWPSMCSLTVSSYLKYCFKGMDKTIIFQNPV